MLLSKPTTTHEIKTLLLRLALVVCAIRLWGTIGALYDVHLVGFSLPVWIGLLEYAFSFAVIIIACRQQLPRGSGWLVPIALLIVFADVVFVALLNDYRSGTPGLTDIYLFTNYAATLVRFGQNPYTFDLADAFRVFRDVETLSSPLQQGVLSGTEVYPPLAWLSLIPFQWLHISPMVLYVGSLLLSFAILYFAAPSALRPLILLPFFIAGDYLNLVTTGVFDYVWVLLILLMIVRWRHRNESAIWYGLACLTKQVPWLFFPFLLLRLWDEGGWRLVLDFLLISLGVFLIINLPFILWNPLAWAHGISAPFTESLIYLAEGPAHLTELGIITMPKIVYTLLTIAAYGLALLLYWRHRDRWPAAMWLVPGIVLWFSYRALLHYWLFLALPLVLEFVSQSGIAEARTLGHKPSRLHWDARLSAAALLAFVAVCAGLLFWYSSRSGEIEVVVHQPVLADKGRVSQLNLLVTNHSPTVLEPRFSIRGPFYHQSVFWHVRSGPDTLASGKSAYYTIDGLRPVTDFGYEDGAEVFVTDAHDSNRRGVALLPFDYSARYQDVVPNGNFAYWRTDKDAPVIWDLITQPDAENSVEWQSPSDSFPRPSIRLKLDSAPDQTLSYVKVLTEVNFPEIPIQLWVKPPASANQAPNFDLVYGLELIANDKQIWVLFGDQTGHGELRPGLSYFMIPAPRETWSLQTINVRPIFDTAGYDIQPVNRPPGGRFPAFSYPTVTLKFRLLVATQRYIDRQVTADFGPISSPQWRPDADALVQQALDHPEMVLIWRADENRRLRNYDLALEDYQLALDANPTAARAFLGIGWIRFEQGDYESATVNFETALDLILAGLPQYSLADLAEAQAGLGWIMLRQGDCAGALVRLDQARRQLVNIDYNQLNQELVTCSPS